MTDRPLRLDDLITAVRASAPTDPLEQLAEAARRKEELDELADSLLGHFVDQARRSGCSWSQIGDALGVTRQAAQQRHAATILDPAKQQELLGELSRFTERARACLERAQEAAVARRHAYVGTEHLLFGLLAVEEGIAARVLVARGFDADRAADLVAGHVPDGAVAVTAPNPYTPRAVSCLAGALREALSMGHNYIGTEHLLLGLYAEKQGIGAKVLKEAGIAKKDVQADVVQILSGLGSA